MRADTKIFGCIADPIDHVKAPTMFTNEFIQRNINAVMIPINVKKDNLKEVLNGLKKINNFCGLTVTIPHKVEVLKYCDHLYDEAQETQAVNWIKFQNKKIVGNNFDGLGFINGLKKSGIITNNKSFCIFGAGGAGMAIAFSLLKQNIQKLKIVNRNILKGKKLKNRLEHYFPESYIELEDLNNYNLANIDVVVNATSIGLKDSKETPFDVKLTKESCIVADIIMEPEETELIKQAKKIKRKVHLGKNMLENQIELAGKFLEIW